MVSNVDGYKMSLVINSVKLTLNVPLFLQRSLVYILSKTGQYTLPGIHHPITHRWSTRKVTPGVILYPKSQTRYLCL